MKPFKLQNEHLFLCYFIYLFIVFTYFWGGGIRELPITIPELILHALVHIWYSENTQSMYSSLVHHLCWSIKFMGNYDNICLGYK